MSWGKEKESQQTGHAPRVFCQPLAFAHTTYPRSILHLYRDLQLRATKHRCDNKLRPETPTSTSARWNLQRIAWLVRNKTTKPQGNTSKSTSPCAWQSSLFAPHLLLQPLLSSQVPEPHTVLPGGGWAGSLFPHQHLERKHKPSQVHPPLSPQPRLHVLKLTPGGEGRQPSSPCSAVRLRAGRGVMESGELFSDNQRWEAAPVNSVHPVAAGSASSSWQQPSPEQWWAQLEIFHN